MYKNRHQTSRPIQEKDNEKKIVNWSYRQKNQGGGKGGNGDHRVKHQNAVIVANSISENAQNQSATETVEKAVVITTKASTFPKTLSNPSKYASKLKTIRNESKVTAAMEKNGGKKGRRKLNKHS